MADDVVLPIATHADLLELKAENELLWAELRATRQALQVRTMRLAEAGSLVTEAMLGILARVQRLEER